MSGKTKCPQCCRVCVNPALTECPSCAAPFSAPKTCRECGKTAWNRKATQCFYCHTRYRQRQHVLPLPPVPKAKQSLPLKAWKLEQSRQTDESVRQDEFPEPIWQVRQVPEPRWPIQQVETQQNEVPSPKWFKNWDNGEWEQWIKNSETGQWEQLQQGNEPERSEVVIGDAQESWHEETDDADSDVREVVVKDVYEDDVESAALEVSATSRFPAPLDVDERLQSFLSSVGPEFNVAFVTEHSGSLSYEALIMDTRSKEDLNPLVDAGMKPLQRNRLFRAIEREREHPAH